jgi:predicted nucleotidyltransferase
MKTDNHTCVARIANLDPIDQLLVECLKVDLPKPATGQLKKVAQLCSSFKGWDHLVQRAGYQGVTGWVYEVLKELDEPLVPGEILKSFQQARLLYTARMAVMSMGQSDLLKALTQAGVEFIILKGPFLAEHVYPRQDLRVYTDIDLLVRESSLGLTGEVLADQGFQIVEEEKSSVFDEGKTQVHYYREDTLPIDLHWQIINLPTHEASISVDMDEIWRSSLKVKIGGVDARVLSREDALLFQCAHMTAHHDFNRLLWFKDVQQVVRRYQNEIDWNLFIEKTRRYRLKTFVFYSLQMTSEICGDLPVPRRVFTDLYPNYLTARLFERLARKSNILELQNSRRRPALEIWRLMRDDRSRRYEASIKRSFPSIEWYLECYPFLPKTRHQKIYYGIYPLLILLRMAKRPVDLNLSKSMKNR